MENINVILEIYKEIYFQNNFFIVFFLQKYQEGVFFEKLKKKKLKKI